MNDATDEIHADIDQTPRQSQTNFRPEVSVLNSGGQPEILRQELGKLIVEERRDNRGIPTLDLSNQPDKPEPRLQLEETKRSEREVSILDLSNLQDEEEATDLQVS